MEGSTLDFYERNALKVAAGYESIDFQAIVDRFLQYLDPASRVLDIGCGSGRDASLAHRMGHAVTAVDGSAAMLEQAAKLHPELRDRTHRVMLPDKLPFVDKSFDGVMSWAVLMHLDSGILEDVFAEIRRVLRPGGFFAYSVNTAREGLDSGGYDERGRRFTCLTRDRWEQVHLETGFHTVFADESSDISGRPGITWVTFLVT